MNQHPIFQEHEIKTNQSLFVKLGSLQLRITNRNNDWLIEHETDTQLRDWNACSKEESQEVLLKKQVRFNKDPTNNQIILKPCLTEKPIVTQPEITLNVQKSCDAEIFISSPLSVKIIDPQFNNSLIEVRTVPISQTWFGPNNISGEICYHLKTNARLNLSNMTFLAHRAITSIKIQNKTNENLTIEKIKVPIQSLALYQNEDKHFCTQPIYYKAKEHIKIEIDDQNTAANWVKWLEPRVPATEQSLIHNIKNLVL